MRRASLAICVLVLALGCAGEAAQEWEISGLSTPPPETLQAHAASVRAAGGRVFLWSNIDPVHLDALGLTRFSRGTSFSLGATKPDVRFYRRGLLVAGGAASEVRFFDDRTENVAMALRLGIEAEMCLEGPAELRQRLFA